MTAAIEALCREIAAREPVESRNYPDASTEPLLIIEHNECDNQLGSLCTTRFRRLFNQLRDERSDADRIARALLATLKVVEAARVLAKLEIAQCADMAEEHGKPTTEWRFYSSSNEVLSIIDALSALDKEIGNE